MSYEVFSQNWVEAFQKALNASAAYRQAAQSWEWPMMLVMEGEEGSGAPEARCIYLDLFHGECRQARVAVAQDQESVSYVVAGSYQDWRGVFDGRIDPMVGLMRGKLSLQKGNMFTLARFGSAAKALVNAAIQVDTLFPDGKSSRETPELRSREGEQLARSPENEHLDFRTTGGTGLRHDLLPMRLYHKAKRLGVWNPRDIDLSQDQLDWQQLTSLEQEVLLRLTSMFQAGEESVTLDILPLIMTIAREGRLEEEMFLATFLWEEAKHTEFFSRFIDEVSGRDGDLARFHGEAYRQIFYQELPAAMNALLTDSSPAAQVRASVTYNMIVEGTLAETGYHAYYSMLERNDIMPGLREGVGYLKRDESRHIAYGIYLLSRLVASDPSLWQVLEKHMERLIDPALKVINELFEIYPELPFGLKLEDFLDYALNQFNKRMTRIESARDKDPEQLALDGYDIQ